MNCQYCGHDGELVWVHGHGQCARCGINVAPCCDGVICDNNLSGKAREVAATEKLTNQPAQVRTWGRSQTN